MQNRTRYHLIDSLRGIAVVSMVLYHFVWDLKYIAGLRWGSYSSLSNLLWQQSICWTFILVSGFCYFLSRRPLKNALVTLIGGAAVTLVTVFATPDAAIYFGVLIFHGSAMLLLLPLRKLLCKIPPIVGIVASFILFLLCYDINNGSLAFGLITLPKALYSNIITAYFGFPPRSFISADYFSFFPWIFLFLTGFFISSLISKAKTPPKILCFKIPVLEWIGRRALIIYLAHQPVLYALTLLIIKIQGE